MRTRCTHDTRICLLARSFWLHAFYGHSEVTDACSYAAFFQTLEAKHEEYEVMKKAKLSEAFKKVSCVIKCSV